MAGWGVPKRRMHPRKSLLRNAEVAQSYRSAARSLGSFENLNLDTGRRQTQPPGVRPADQRRRILMNKHNIDVQMGEAKVTARDAVEVTDREAKDP